MDVESWTCDRCQSVNEPWRNWCKTCSSTHPSVRPASPPFAAPPAPSTSTSKERPAIVAVGIVVALLVVIGVVAFVVTRPGGRTHTTTVAAPSTASDTGAASTSASPDETVANNVLLHPDDFPSGWRESEKVQSATSRAASNELANCMGDVGQPGQVTGVDAHSPDYTIGSQTAASSVTVQATTDRVAEDFAKVSDGHFLACLHDVFVDMLGGPEVCTCLGFQVDATQMPVPPNAPPMTYAFRVTLTRDGQLLTQIDGVLIGEGRSEVSLDFVGKSNPFPPGLEIALVQDTLDRMAANPTS